MISVENISVHFGSFELFNNISFVVNTKDRIGLIGKNGAGKTTLLRILAKDENPKTGNIIYPPEITLGYLPQQMRFSSKKTVWKETMEVIRG